MIFGKDRSISDEMRLAVEALWPELVHQAAAKIMTLLTMPSPEGISSPLGPALADAFKGRFSAKTL